MNQLAALMKNEAVKRMAIGLSVSILLPVVVSLLAPVVRPLARSTLKAGIMAYEKGRETIAEIGEVIDDLVAEVQEELQEARGEDVVAIEAEPATNEAVAEGIESR